jgi:hypothetical protein
MISLIASWEMRLYFCAYVMRCEKALQGEAGHAVVRLLRSVETIVSIRAENPCTDLEFDLFCDDGPDSDVEVTCISTLVALSNTWMKVSSRYEQPFPCLEYAPNTPFCVMKLMYVLSSKFGDGVLDEDQLQPNA